MISITYGVRQPPLSSPEIDEMLKYLSEVHKILKIEENLWKSSVKYKQIWQDHIAVSGTVAVLIYTIKWHQWDRIATIDSQIVGGLNSIGTVIQCPIRCSKQRKIDTANRIIRVKNLLVYTQTILQNILQETNKKIKLNI
jgi:hypothetical protein